MNDCIAVGQQHQGLDRLALAEHWNGAFWTIDASATPVAFLASNLGGVACVTTNWCEAVGFTADVFDTLASLAEHWNGSNWTIESAPTPPLAIANAPLWTDVSCARKEVCTAAGNHVNPTFERVTLAMHLSGHTWSLQPTPNPAGSSDSELTGIACTPPKRCVASGFSFGGMKTLVERFG